MLNVYCKAIVISGAFVALFVAIEYALVTALQHALGA
jgi:hypothetical protein